MTNSDEEVTAGYSYDAWGRLTAQTGSSGNRYGFTSREWEDEIGLQFNRARFYDPEIGRFITRDPLTGSPDDPTISYFSGVYSQFHRFIKEYVDALQPDRHNRYVYCYNNPVNLIDPLGLSPEEDQTQGAKVEAEKAETGGKKEETAGQSQTTGTEQPGQTAGDIGAQETGQGIPISTISASFGSHDAFSTAIPRINKNDSAVTNIARCWGTHINNVVALALNIGLNALEFPHDILRAVGCNETDIEAFDVGCAYFAASGQITRAVQIFQAASAQRAAMGEALASNNASTLTDDLGAAAARARTSVGPGRGGAYGTRVHTAFEGEVNALGRSNLYTERSYLNGELVRRGTPGSVRVDVVNGSPIAPVSIYDLKTGGATLTPARIQQIQSHIPGGSAVPVYEVKP